MKALVLAMILLLLGSRSMAQPVKTEVSKAVSEAQDSKPNSSTVPQVMSLSGQFARVVVMRFKYDVDLLTGLEEKVKEEGIKNAVILAGMGSVRNYHFHVVSNRSFPSKNIYVWDTAAPADITGMNGYIINGRVHTHITFATADSAFGGHLEQGTTVFTFAVVTLGVLSDGMDVSRIDDKTFR